MLTLNPWLTMWVSPRKTIREVVTYNPDHRLWILSFIFGVGSLLGISQSYSMGHIGHLSMIILLSVILAPIWGYIMFSVGSFFVSFTGKWIGGHGNYKQIRSSMAWSNVPMIVNVICWFLLITIFGSDLFKDFPGGYLLSGGEFWLLFSLLIIQLTVGIWSIILYIISLSEVQMFSIIKSIVNLIIAFIFIAIVIFIAINLAEWLISFGSEIEKPGP